MQKILITGATGNIGKEVIKFYHQLTDSHTLVAGVRDVDKSRKSFGEYPNVDLVHFDFEDANSFPAALQHIDILFLLRPPHISDVPKYFKPLLEAAVVAKVKGIVFLSVQGAERSNIIPHAKIEKLIVQAGIDYVFLRPGYFMQNLTTTWAKDIQQNRKISLPAGQAKFCWVDVENIGEVAAHVLLDVVRYRNQVIEITGTENKNFKEVCALLSEVLEETVTYESVGPIRFYLRKRKEGVSSGLALVMLILHFLPRFQSVPALSTKYQEITGKVPTLLRAFMARERSKFYSAKN